MSRRRHNRGCRQRVSAILGFDVATSVWPARCVSAIRCASSSDAPFWCFAHRHLGNSVTRVARCGDRSSVGLSSTSMAVRADSPPRRYSVSFRFISIHLPHKRPRCVRDRYAALRLTLPYAVDDWSPNARVSGDLSARFVGMHQVLGPLWRRGRRHSLKVRSASRPHVLAVVALLIAATQCWVSATWRVVHATMVWGIPQMPPSTIPPPFSSGTEKGARSTSPGRALQQRAGALDGAVDRRHAVRRTSLCRPVER